MFSNVWSQNALLSFEIILMQKFLQINLILFWYDAAASPLLTVFLLFRYANLSSLAISTA